MAGTIAKTIVATGASSGLGFEAIKQLLGHAQPYKFILGARDTARTQAAFDELKPDGGKHDLTILPLDLSNLKEVKSFAQRTLEKLGQDKLDYLFLNAALIKPADMPWAEGGKWCESYVVNHLAQHYLIHLLHEKLAASQSRLVIVSSGAVRRITDPTTLESTLKNGSGADVRDIYSASKFAQLLGAHWWRRQIGDQCQVVAVSPGLIPQTGLARHSDFKLTMDMPDAKTVSEGASSLLRAFTIDNFPEDPDEIFLTSWGEWWGKETIEKSLDKSLQDKWSPGKEEVEKDAGLA